MLEPLRGNMHEMVRTLSEYAFDKVGEYPVRWSQNYMIYSVKSKEKRTILDPFTRGSQAELY